MTSPLAIPGPDEPPWSATHIRLLTSDPPPSLRSVRRQLDELVRAGEVEAIPKGRWTYYRRSQSTVVGGQARAVVSCVDPAYNVSTDWFLTTLSPLRDGKPVTLWMDQHHRSPLKYNPNAKYRVPARRLIVVSPYQDDVLLVAVLGAGSCLVHMTPQEIEIDVKNVANLVLAGVPAKLAQVLMNAVRQVLQ